MSELCCGGTRSRIGCEYHDPALQPAASAAPATVKELEAHIERQVARALGYADGALPPGARLLGPDDPEVLGPGVSPDLIYAIPGGGVFGVPQGGATAAAPSVLVVHGPDSWSRNGRSADGYYHANMAHKFCGVHFDEIRVLLYQGVDAETCQRWIDETGRVRLKPGGRILVRTERDAELTPFVGGAR